MSGPLSKKIRELLDEFDGLTSLELAGMLRTNKHLVAASIRTMQGRLIYVDRWQPAGVNGEFARVWANVPVPEDCPKPK